MRVLAAVDGSLGSFEAISQVASLLAPDKDEVTLYCSPPEVRLRSHAASGELIARARQSLADAIFEEARKRLPEGLQNRVRTIVGTQDPRHGIVLAAEQSAANLIVVGARGLGTLERLLLGSVSRAVVHSAKVPVWVARSKSTPAVKSLRILLACASPEAGRQSAELLSGLNWPEGTTCRALTVISSIFAGHVPDWLEQQARSPEVEEMVRRWALERDEERRGNLAQLQDFVQTLPAALQPAQALIAEGQASDQIIATIDRENIDLVVIGAVRKRSMVNVIMGSTSEAVLNHARCSVLVMPHRENP